MKIVCCALSLLAACAFPARSERYACQTTADCDQGRTCDEFGFCVKATVDAGGDTMAPDDGGLTDDATVFMDASSAQVLAMKCQAAGYTLAAGPNGYYKSVATGATWVNAQAACAADVPGSSHLIVLSTTAEVTYMAGQLGWVGLSDRTTENQFLYVTGELGERPWAGGQPDNGSGSEDCAQMKSGGLLDDDQCGNSHRYVCECDGRMSMP